MPRPISAVIDLLAMRRNLALARRHARGRFVWAVVKANAYGHGLVRAVRAFAEADGLALLDLDEAQRARDAGWSRPILLLEGCFEARELDTASSLKLTVVVHEASQIDMLERARLPAPIDVYLKLNTGMNRLGFDSRQAHAAYARLKACTNVAQLTLMIHFANADRAAGASGPTEVAEQMAALQSIAGDWPEPRSFANSAALFLRPEVQGDSVRPGIALYGAATDESHTAAELGVVPAMTLQSRLIAVQNLECRASSRLRIKIPGTASDSHRRRRVRLCRWLSAPCTRWNLGADRRRSGTHCRACVDGHDHRRLDVGSARRCWQRRRAVGQEPSDR